MTDMTDKELAARFARFNAARWVYVLRYEIDGTPTVLFSGYLQSVFAARHGRLADTGRELDAWLETDEGQHDLAVIGIRFRIKDGKIGPADIGFEDGFAARVDAADALIISEMRARWVANEPGERDKIRTFYQKCGLLWIKKDGGAVTAYEYDANHPACAWLEEMDDDLASVPVEELGRPQ